VGVVDGSTVFDRSGEQGFNAILDLSLAAGETASLLWFVEVEGINQDGLDIATKLDDHQSDLFQSLISDLSSTQLN